MFLIAIYDNENPRYLSNYNENPKFILAVMKTFKVYVW